FLRLVAERFESTPPGVLLTKHSPGQIADAIAELQEGGAELVTGGREASGSGYGFQNTLLRASGDQFLARPKALQREAFGPVSLVVIARDADQFAEIAALLEGNLTGSIYSHTDGRDDVLYEKVEPILRTKVGRLLNDKMPTGVAVSPAMVHGGHYPATGHPGFTAVGIPAAMVRFAALPCSAHVRAHRLPPELQDKNPTGRTWRFIDGEWTQRDL